MQYPWKRLAIAAVVSLTGAVPAGADVIADWNVCSQPIIAAGRGTIQFGAGPSTQLDLAFVHLAMHDAVQAYDHRFKSYAAPVTGGVGSAAAAAARAAHRFLSARFSSTQQAQIDACYLSSTSGMSLSQAEWDDSNAVGTAAANNLITLRNGNFGHPANPVTPFTGGTGPGQWRPNAGTVSMVAPWFGDVPPLGLGSLSRCEPGERPALTSGEYTEAFNEVKAVGSETSAVRTDDQGHIARTFSGNFGGQFNRLMRELVALEEAHLAGSDVASLGDRARLFALVNMAGADSLICSWNAKKKFNFWRPDRAIREADTDGNPLTEFDPGWKPYMATPNYGDYTSGANNITGSMMRALALFFDGDHPFATKFRIYWLGGAVALLPDDLPYREYSRFSDVAKDVVDARVYLGIHFRFADTEARSQGRRVAQYVFKNQLTPLSKK